MFSRRDLCLGLGCVVSLGAAELLKPRSNRSLIALGTPLQDLVPGQLAHWRAGGAGEIVLPQTEGSLASRLYSDQLARVYRSDEGQREVMLLIAHGPNQTDSLQLHRPETCYPAAGFEIVDRKLIFIAAGNALHIPAVALTAWSPHRTEDILYWTRIGQALPRTAGEQRIAVLRGALSGFVDDGVLVRASAVRRGPKPVFEDVRAFLVSMVDALPPRARIGLVGH